MSEDSVHVDGMKKMRHLTSCIVTSVFACTALAQEDPGALIREGSRASREAIKTLHARYETRLTPVALPKAKQPSMHKPTTTKVEWWQDGSQIRCKEESTLYMPKERQKIPAAHSTSEETVQVTQRRDTAVNAKGEVTVIMTSRGPRGDRISAQINYYAKDKGLGISDVWAAALFILQTRPRATLAEMLDRPGSLKKLERVQVGGKLRYRLIVAAIPPMDYDYHLEVDPGRNFLVTSLVPQTTSPKAVFRGEKRVVSAREFAPGIYFPTELEGKIYAIKGGTDSGTLIHTSRTRFQLVEINRPIDASLFRLDPPPGAAVVDYRDNTSFIMGANGKPVGEVGPAPERSPVPAQPTYREPPSHSYTPALIIGGIGILTVVVLSILARRWWRKANAAKPNAP